LLFRLIKRNENIIINCLWGSVGRPWCELWGRWFLRPPQNLWGSTSWTSSARRIAKWCNSNDSGSQLILASHSAFRAFSWTPLSARNSISYNSLCVRPGWAAARLSTSRVCIPHSTFSAASWTLQRSYLSCRSSCPIVLLSGAK